MDGLEYMRVKIVAWNRITVATVKCHILVYLHRLPSNGTYQSELSTTAFILLVKYVHGINWELWWLICLVRRPINATVPLDIKRKITQKQAKDYNNTKNKE